MPEQYSVEYHPLFWKDVESQALYIESVAGLGVEFIQELEKAIQQVKERPMMWSRLFGNTRHVILNRFHRHVIHFECLQEQKLIRFYGLFHGAEDPHKWTERL